MGRRSITVRLAVFAAAVFAVISTIAAVVGVTLLRSELIEELDRSNLARAADLAIQTELNAEVPFIGVPTDTTGAAILDEDGFLVSATDEFDENELFDIYFANEDDVGFDVSFDLPTIAGGDSMRGIVSSAFSESDDRAYAVFVASSTQGLDRTVRLVIGAVAVAIPLLTLLVGALVFAMAKRSLRSVERLRSDVESFDGDDLGRRLPDPDVDDELGRLATTMNGMLDRIESSAERQRRFAADASHELRSPLASMATQLDVDLAHPDAANWAATASSLRDETTRMQRLVDDLLLLARTGAASSAAADVSLVRDVAIDDLVADAAATVAVTTDAEITTSRLDRVSLTADETAVRRIVDNLLANAARHARSRVDATVLVGPGTSLDGRVDTNPTDAIGAGRVEIAIDDDGPGVDRSDRARIFDRFVRLDDARSRDDGGSGLGLAICRELADALGGDVRVEDGRLGGARFVLRLPVEPPVEPPRVS